MKKKVFYALLVLNFSCKSFDDFRNQKVVLETNKSQKIEFKNGVYYLNLKVNGVSGNFLFDTGAMTSVINDDNYLNQFHLTPKNYYTSYKLKGPDGVQIESNKFVSDSIKSDIINGSKNIFNHITNVKATTDCLKENEPPVGIIGFDIFKRASQPILFDISNNEIRVLQSKYNINGYQKLDTNISSIFGSEIIIPVKINNKIIKFTLDTGFNGGVLISSKEDILSKSNLYEEFEIGFITVSKLSVSKAFIYSNINIADNYLFTEPTIISTISNINKNLLGINFIKQFNWIFDFNSGVVYVKRISNSNTETLKVLEKLQITSLSFNGELLIVYKKINCYPNFHLLDKIISVNGKSVTPENICEMQDLLNKTQNWDSLKLEVIPKTK